MDQWSKTTSHKNRVLDSLQQGELRSYCGSSLVKFVFLDLTHQLRAHFQDGRHCSTSSSSSSSSPTVSDTKTREREDRIESDISPVHVSTTVDDRSGRPDDNQANKNPNQIKRNPRRNRATRCVPRSRSGCNNLEKFWWMTKFKNMDTLTPVLFMKRLWRPYSRDVRICVSTMFILIHLKTEIARSARGLKLQGLHAEDAMAEPYLELTILVT